MRKIISIFSCMLLLATVVAVTIPINADDWSMFRHDIQHTGYSTDFAPDTNNTLWIIGETIGETIGSTVSSPAVVDGKIYIGSDEEYGPSHMYCFNAENGSLDWTYDLDSDPEGPTVSIISSPAVANGRVYFGADNGKIYCLDANNEGNLLWEYQTGSSGSSVVSSPTVAFGRVYVGSYDCQLYCFDEDLSDGIDDGHDDSGADYDLIWMYDAVGGISSSPAIYNDRVYIVSTSNGMGAYQVHCMHYIDGGAMGGLYWVKGLDNTSEMNTSFISSPTVVNDKLYIGSFDFNSGEGKTICLDANSGDEIWRNLTGDTVKSSPAVYDEKVFVGSNDGKLYCFNANNGDKLWDFETYDPKGVAEIISSPAVADEKVYFGAGNGLVYCLNINDGNEIWNYSTGESIKSSPAVVNDRVYIANEVGKIYCFEDVNHLPSKPDLTGDIMDGETGKVGHEYNYSATATDIDERDILFFNFSWGDGDYSGWLGPKDSGETVETSHIWTGEGEFTINVTVKDQRDFENSTEINVSMVINEAPEMPNRPSGMPFGYADVVYDFSTNTTDPNGDQILYKFYGKSFLECTRSVHHPG